MPFSTSLGGEEYYYEEKPVGATSVTGVGGGSAHGSEHRSLGVSHLIGPRWTERHEETFKKMMKDYADNSFLVPAIGDNVLRHRKMLTVLVITQILMFGALVALGSYVFWG